MELIVKFGSGLLDDVVLNLFGINLDDTVFTVLQKLLMELVDR